MLREILRNQPARFKNYAELTIMKTLEAHKDSHKEVSNSAYPVVQWAVLKPSQVKASSSWVCCQEGNLNAPDTQNINIYGWISIFALAATICGR